MKNKKQRLPAIINNISYVHHVKFWLTMTQNTEKMRKAVALDTWIHVQHSPSPSNVNIRRWHTEKNFVQWRRQQQNALSFFLCLIYRDEVRSLFFGDPKPCSLVLIPKWKVVFFYSISFVLQAFVPDYHLKHAKVQGLKFVQRKSRTKAGGGEKRKKERKTSVCDFHYNTC